ncbi:MAG: site-specific integrase [Myxococcota bacterium]
MPRKREGKAIKITKGPRAGRWQPVVTLADNSTKRVSHTVVEDGIEVRVPLTFATRDEAKNESLRLQEKASKLRRRAVKTPQSTLAGSDVPAGAWVAAWQATREHLPSAGEGMSHWIHHLRARLGAKHPREWTEADLRAVVRDLDDKVAVGSISWKTAQNIWGTATRMCVDATKSKHDSLRCRVDNPATNVAAPDRGDRKELQFLYPAELLAVVTHSGVPLNWRRLIAIATYTYVRAGALSALSWDSVDLDHGVIHVHRAVERRSGATKGTKGKRARRVAIHDNIRPLLRAMYLEGDDHVIKVPSDASRTFRRMLDRAGVERAELFETTTTRRAIRFHDLRSTGITYLAVAGVEPLKIMQRAGHRDIDTTMRYVRLAEEIGRDFGEPFPALPASLLGDNSHLKVAPGSQVPGIWRKRTGIEPARDS